MTDLSKLIERYSAMSINGRKPMADVPEITSADTVLEVAVKIALKRLRNARGAIESNQVVDKDVHGSLGFVMTLLMTALEDAALQSKDEANVEGV